MFLNNLTSLIALYLISEVAPPLIQLSLEEFKRFLFLLKLSLSLADGRKDMHPRIKSSNYFDYFGIEEFRIFCDERVLLLTT